MVLDRNPVVGAADKTIPESEILAANRIDAIRIFIIADVFEVRKNGIRGIGDQKAVVG
jgi:hypothetical protein